jgi:hypothetical protein
MYRLAHNRLYHGGYEHEAHVITKIYSDLLDMNAERLHQYARNRSWLLESRIEWIAKQTLDSHNLFVASMCLADTAALLNRMGREADARQLGALAEELDRLSYDAKREGC